MEVVAEDLDRDLRLDARKQLIHPHLDGLRVAELHPGDGSELFPNRSNETFLGMRRRPLRTRRQQHVGIALTDPHGVRRDVRSAGAAHNMPDFRQLHDGLFNQLHGLQRLFERDRWDLKRLHDDRAFVHGRQELGAQRRHQRAGYHEQPGRGAQDDPRVIERPPKLGPVNPSYHIRRVRDLPTAEDRHRFEDQRRKNGNHGHGEYQRTAEGNANGVGQRREHLALHTLQRCDRDEHHDDHRHTKGYGPSHLGGRLAHHTATFPLSVLRTRKQPDRVFHQHNGAVAEHADGDGEPGQSHEIERHAEETHHEEGGEGRHGQLQRHQRRRPEVAHEENQNQQHQDGTLQQRATHGAEGRGHQLVAIVKGHYFHVRRQRLPSQLELLPHPVHHVTARPTAQHEHDAGYGLPTAVSADSALTDLGCELHFGHLPEHDRHAVAVSDHSAF